MAQISLAVILVFPPHFFKKGVLLCLGLLTTMSYKMKHVYCHSVQGGSHFFLYEFSNEEFKIDQCGIVIMRKPKLSGLITSKTKIAEEYIKCLNRNIQCSISLSVVMG